jgi:hypothetical protein
MEQKYISLTVAALELSPAPRDFAAYRSLVAYHWNLDLINTGVSHSASLSSLPPLLYISWSGVCRFCAWDGFIDLDKLYRLVGI